MVTGCLSSPLLAALPLIQRPNPWTPWTNATTTMLGPKPRSPISPIWFLEDRTPLYEECVNTVFKFTKLIEVVAMTIKIAKSLKTDDPERLLSRASPQCGFADIGIKQMNVNSFAYVSSKVKHARAVNGMLKGGSMLSSRFMRVWRMKYSKVASKHLHCIFGPTFLRYKNLVHSIYMSHRNHNSLFQPKIHRRTYNDSHTSPFWDIIL